MEKVESGVSMNRRRFLELLSAATVGGVAYSFPSVIVAKNIAPEYTLAPRGLAYLINSDVPWLTSTPTPMSMYNFVIFPFWQEVNGVLVNVK